MNYCDVTLYNIVKVPLNDALYSIVYKVGKHYSQLISK